MSLGIVFGLLIILIVNVGIILRAACAWEEIKWGTSCLATSLKRDLKWIIGFAVWTIGEVLTLLFILMALT